MLKYLFSEQAVVAELREGALKPNRAKDFLLFALALSIFSQLVSGVFQAMGKSESALLGSLGYIAMALVVGLGAYFLFRWLLGNLYEANGGSEGKHFYERLFVLFLSAGLRLLVVLIPFLVVGSLTLVWLLPRVLEAMWVFYLYMAVYLGIIVIAPIVYVYRRVKAGLLAVNA
jgi:hypothetical protein